MPEIIEGEYMPEMADFSRLYEVEEVSGVTFTLDFHNEEIIIFSEGEKPIVFDFSNFSIGNIDKESVEKAYGNDINVRLPRKIKKLVRKLKQVIGTDVFLIGDSWMRYLAIQVYNQFIIIGQILVDMEDFDPDGPDGDGGEPIPEIETSERRFLIFLLANLYGLL